MKKALVLGVMAVFAINFMTVQNVIAQERGTTTPNKVTLNSKPTTIKNEKPATTVTTSSTAAEGKKHNSNVAAATQGAVNQATHDTEEVTSKPYGTLTTTSTAPQGKKNVNQAVSAKKGVVTKAATPGTKKGKAAGKDLGFGKAPKATRKMEPQDPKADKKIENTAEKDGTVNIRQMGPKDPKADKKVVSKAVREDNANIRQMGPKDPKADKKVESKTEKEDSTIK